MPGSDQSSSWNLPSSGEAGFSGWVTSSEPNDWIGSRSFGPPGAFGDQLKWIVNAPQGHWHEACELDETSGAWTWSSESRVLRKGLERFECLSLFSPRGSSACFSALVHHGHAVKDGVSQDAPRCRQLTHHLLEVVKVTAA